MTILAIDDEPVMLRHLKKELQKVFPQAEILTFDECDEVLAFLETPKARNLHYAFMDIKLRGMLGIELAMHIKDHCPKTRILFCTAYSIYALEAYQIHALGYLMKPVDADKLREAVLQIEAQLGTLPETTPQHSGQLVVHTFGSFEVLYNGVPLVFEREKAKELLALLIDRQGLSMTNGEIESVLWENPPSPHYLHTLFHSLRKTLHSIGLEDLLIRTRNHTSIDVNKVQCDLYEFLKGDADAVNSYAGEYMNNYSWAELTNARLYTGNISDFVLTAQTKRH
jgi:two-component system, LytTR family, response regulator